MGRRWSPLALAAVGALAAGCAQTEPEAAAGAAPHVDVTPPQTTRPPASAPPAAPAAEEPLVLLDDGPSVAAPRKEGAADNSRCHVCHLNFVQEHLVVTHARAGVGCEKCHGPSDAHIADESWGSGGNGTAPDIMFTKDMVNPFCLGCHPRDAIDPGAHEEFFVAANPQERCIDCHGKHRLASRKCIWK